MKVATVTINANRQGAKTPGNGNGLLLSRIVARRASRESLKKWGKQSQFSFGLEKARSPFGFVFPIFSGSPDRIWQRSGKSPFVQMNALASPCLGGNTLPTGFRSVLPQKSPIDIYLRFILN